MSIEQFNTFLKKLYLKTPLLALITGASGAGKTFLAETLEKTLDPKLSHIAFFDSIGVPTILEMIRQWGSSEKWQEKMTHQWIERLILKDDKKIIILEGQFNPQFAIDACQELKIENYLVINVYANKGVRHYRLTKLRGQRHLVNATMDNWAEVLKERTCNVGGYIVDNSSEDIGNAFKEIIHLIQKKCRELEDKEHKKT